MGRGVSKSALLPILKCPETFWIFLTIPWKHKAHRGRGVNTEQADLDHPSTNDYPDPLDTRNPHPEQNSIKALIFLKTLIEMIHHFFFKINLIDSNDKFE